MSGTFLHRLFARRVADRWPAAARARWDGEGAAAPEAADAEAPCGAPEADAADESDEKRETLDELVLRARSARGAELRRLTSSKAERVLVAVLGNPELGADGARAIARRAQSANVLAELARNRTLSSDPEVAQALCMNTKTPFFASRSLLGSLPVHVLREIALSSTTPPALAKEALSAISDRRTRRQRGS